MAKLNVVVPSNEIEVSGQKYRKVERKAQAGDIVKALTNDHADVVSGAFYEITTRSEVVGFYDDNEDFRSVVLRKYPLDFEVYEKVAPEYREVKREAKVGERIRIVNAGFAGNPPTYKNGEEFTVVEIKGNTGVRIDRKWLDNGDIKAWVAHREYVVLEPVNYGEPAPQPNRRLTVGDYAKVIAKEGGHKYDIGSVVKIVIDDRDGRPYKGERADGTVGNWLAEHEVIPATEAEFSAQKRLNVGDYAKVVDASGCRLAKVGDIVTVTQTGELIWGNTFDGRHITMFDHRFVRATESEVEAAKKAAERAKKIGEFADGGYAEIVNANPGNATYKAQGNNGLYVKVEAKESPLGSRQLTLTLPDGTRGGYCDADALRKVTREEYEEATKPKPAFNVGDKVKFILPEGKPARYGRAGVKFGEIGTVERATEELVEVTFPSFGSRFSADPSELEKISAEEVARIEEEAKWSAIGRKVNEFKRGDIIEATRRLGEQERIYGEYTGERDEVALGVKDASRNYRSVSAHSAKLLIPVEQRFDLSEGGADLSK